MVPGSTLMYGSSLISATFRPRASSRQPIEDAARPFPKLETTPPVTKIYFGIAYSLFLSTLPASLFALCLLTSASSGGDRLESLSYIHKVQEVQSTTFRLLTPKLQAKAWTLNCIPLIKFKKFRVQPSGC